MEKLFRNKILIRTSSSFSSSFFIIPLSISNINTLITQIDLRILCCKLSRSYRLACFLQVDVIFVVFQRSQCDSAASAVEEIVRLFPSIDVGAEEEVKSASLIAKAVECELRSAMLDDSWTHVGQNFFVQSTFACSEEKKHLCAINVRVQAETNDGIVFLVSPDVVWFKRHKISDLASSGELETFEKSNIVNLEGHGIPTSCTVLPSLYEGHVIGISKELPVGETFNKFEELLLFNNGLYLPSSYFVNIQFNNGGDINKQWYPSAFVLQGSGLSPAPHSIRTSKSTHALDLFVNLVGGWDFFSQGLLKVKEVFSLGPSTLLPVWTKATSTLKHATVQDNLLCTSETSRGKNPGSTYLNLALKSERMKVSNVTRKMHISAIESMSEVTTAESGIVIESRVTEQDIPAEVVMIKATREESVNRKETSMNETTLAEKRSISSEDCVSRVTTTESDLASESSVTGNNHTSYKDCMSEHGVSMQKVEDCVQSNSRALEKVAVEESLRKQCSANSKKVPSLEILEKKTLNNGRKSKEAASGSCKKMKTKPSVDTSDIVSKVMDCHSRGILQSISVPELKSFLTTKKARVGGKKEELIQRVTTLLA